MLFFGATPHPPFFIICWDAVFIPDDFKKLLNRTHTLKKSSSVRTFSGHSQSSYCGFGDSTLETINDQSETSHKLKREHFPHTHTHISIKNTTGGSVTLK